MRYETMAFLKKPKPDLTDIESELIELRKFKDEVESRGRGKSKLPIFLSKLWAGPRLAKSIEDWLSVKGSRDSETAISATANLLAAILRRFMRVSFIFFLMAFIPILLIIWQNIIMERQNQSLIAQIKAERTASSNQQVTEYLRLLLSSDERQVAAAEGFLVSDVVNRDLAVERLAALIKSGNSDVQCSALTALTGILKSDSSLTLKEAIAPEKSGRAIVGDLQCEEIDFGGVDFGAMTFVDVGFHRSNFRSADVSQVEFQKSNLRHSDFLETPLCNEDRRCVRFQDVDLSYANMTFTHQSKDVFHAGLILQGTQLNFERHDLNDANAVKAVQGSETRTSKPLTVPNFGKENIVARGVCYQTSFSKCYLFHKNRDLDKLDELRLNSLKQANCPMNLDGPIVLTTLSSCEKLGLQRRW